MHYFVSRNSQTYGPYTVDDLHRYLASGHVLPTDLAQARPDSDDPSAATPANPGWIPVTELMASLGAAPSTSQAPPFVPGQGSFAPGYPGQAASPVATFAAYPPPPNLNWILLLFLGIFTGGIFTVIYELIQASWMRRVYPPSRVLLFYIIAAVFWFMNLSFSFGNAFAIATHHASGRGSAFGGLASLAYLIMLLVARFTMRSELEQHYNSAEPIGLSLSGIMTFFFGSLYFQYHFNRINELRSAALLASGYPPR